MVATAQTISKLERIYTILERSILQYQHPITGLLPATLFKGGPMMAFKDSWVRDNVYGIIGAWALALAYRKAYDNDNNVPRADELENVTVKLMQSLLKSMMRQSQKVEKFKKSLSCDDALHAKYSYETGVTMVGDKEWGHLQLDATSLFLLILAEMIESGLHVVNTLDEVCFIQNLVFYIEKAFKTPDYGIWERGDKTNNGVPELNACSIGMAKAAMEAMTDFNLFGSTGGPSSLIHVQPDNIQRCNTILESMLPRESLSKEIGSSLLSIIGFPAFAVDSQYLIDITKDTIKDKLEGRYGFKRFLRDGYCTVRSDPNKLHYDLVELEKFENIECEWPLFFAFMCINGYFCEDYNQAEEYYEKLNNVLMKFNDGIPMVPQLYYVPEDKVHEEIKNPHSQERLPGIHIPFIWAQSLYILCMIFHEELLAPADIDPLNQRYRFIVEHSSVIQIALVAKDLKSYDLMQQINVPVHSPNDSIVKNILPASTLNAIYGSLGRCQKSGLSGRVVTNNEILTTSIFYKTDTYTYGFYPQLLDQKHFYLYLDSDLFVKLLTIEIEYLRTNWKLQGRPTIIIPIKERLLDHKKFPLFMEMIKRFKTGNYMGIRVNLDYIQNHLNTACIVNLKFISSSDVENIVNEMNKINNRPRRNSTTIFNLESENFYSESTENLVSSSIFELSNDNNSQSESDTSVYPQNETLNVNSHFEDSLDINTRWKSQTYEDFIKDLETSKSFKVKVYALLNLHNMFGDNYEIVLSNSGYHGTVLCLLNDLYQRVCENLLWRYIRSVAAHLNIYMDNLSQACSDIIVREKQLTIGFFNGAEKVIDKPFSNIQLEKILNECYPNAAIYRLLTQEIIAYISMLIRTSPELFNGMLRIRVGIILNVLLGEFSRTLHLKDDEVMDVFLSVPPADVIQLLSLILYRKEFHLKRENNKIIIDGNEHIKKRSRTKSVMIQLNSDENDGDSNASHRTISESIGLWFRRRSLDGALNNYYESFFKDVWLILKHSKGISFANYNLSNEIIFEMTPGEMKFALRVESALSAFIEPEYRQLAVEVISVFTSLIKQLNKPIYLDHIFPIDRIITSSNEIFLQHQASINGDAISCCANRLYSNRRCNGYNSICRFFYDSAPSGPYGTMNIIMQTIITYLELNNILNENDQFNVD